MSTNSNGTPATAPASVGADLEQIRAVVDYLPYLAWSCRPDGHCEYLSRRWVEYTGVPETEHHGTGWLSAVHPDDRERTRAGWEAFVAGAGEYDVDYRLRRRDGAYRWFKTRGVLATGAGGRPARVFGTTTDIDDQKRAEERLRAGEERQRFLADLAAATQPLTDPDEVTAVAARLLAEHLGADRCAYAEVEDEFVYVITGDHCRGVPSVVGRWPIAAFGDEHLRVMRADEPYVVSDTDADPRVSPTHLPAYHATGIRAVVCVPLHKAGRLTAAMAVHQRTARGWTADEVELVRTVVGRCWEALARASALRRLQKSEERLRLATEGAGVGTWEIDLGTGRGTWSPEAVKLFGSARSDFTATDWTAAVHPDDRERASESWRKAVEEGVPYEIQFRAATPGADGGERWLLSRGQVERDAAGRPVRGAGVLLDVTAQRRVEEALHAGEAFTRSVTDVAPSILYVYDLAEHRNVWGNREVTTLLGFSRRELDALAGNLVPALLHPDDRESYRLHVGRIMALADGESAEFEYRMRHADGSYRWLFSRDMVFRRAAAGRPTQIVGAALDITDRKRAEEALRGSEERFRSLVTATAQVVWTAAPDGVVVADSPTWRAFTGQTTEQWVGWGWGAAVHPDDRAAAVAAWRHALANRSIIDHEYRLRRHDGEYRWTAVRVVPVLEADGRVREWVGTNTDITARKTIEQERERLVEQLRDADRRKDEFLATLAHELRNPLAPIRNGLQVMRLAADNAAAVAKARDMMDRQLGHMVRLVDDLLDVSRITRGKLELRRGRLLLADVVASAVETARPAIDAARHRLTVSLPPEPLVLNGDLTRLAQVVGNLLSNAAKYTPDPGDVRLTAAADGGEAVVRVEDTGVGIPADALGRIFDMFSQVDRSLERATGGLGIGLALVKGLVEMHGGRVAAESAGEGRGSAFTVRLPLSPDQPPPGGVTAATDERVIPGPSRRVLVVDDNPDAARSLAEMLALLGHDVRLAHDGRDAVARAGEFRPEVILMDVGMPRLNGLDATRLIRGEPWGKAVTIVALTGWGQEADRAKSALAGCDGHLVKPVNLGDLQTLLHVERRP